MVSFWCISLRNCMELSLFLLCVLCWVFSVVCRK